MSPPIPSINLLLPPPNEGNVNSDFVLKLQTPFKPSCPRLNRTSGSSSTSTNSPPQQSASVSPSGVSRAAAARTNPAPCFVLPVRLTCAHFVLVLFFTTFDARSSADRGMRRGVFPSLSGVTAGERATQLLLNGPGLVTSDIRAVFGASAAGAVAVDTRFPLLRNNPTARLRVVEREGDGARPWLP